MWTQEKIENELENITIIRKMKNGKLQFYELYPHEEYVLFDENNIQEDNYFEVFICPTTYDYTSIKAYRKEINYV